MKFKVKEQIKVGTKRIVKRFAFFPITEYVKIESSKWLKEGLTIWLETVYIKQIRIDAIGGELGGNPASWGNLEFVSKKEFEEWKLQNE